MTPGRMIDYAIVGYIVVAIFLFVFGLLLR
jgi:hypothetical protein